MATGVETRRGAFSRTASGLTREIAPIHHWIYNVFTLLVLTGAAFFYLWAPGVYPGTSPVLGLIVAAIAVIPIYTAYSMLASAMPRSGGDYVFQSRILHPALAFTALAAQVVWLWYWLELSGFWIAAMVFSPLFSMLGFYTGNPGLLNLAAWFSGQQGIFWTAIIVNLLVAIAFIPGLRTYLKIQWVLFAGVIVSLVTMTIVLLTTSHAAFVANFNGLMAAFDPQQADYYQYIIDTAYANGFSPSAGGGLGGLIAVVAVAWFNLIWAVWSMPNLGEIKHANNFGVLFRVMQLSLGFGLLVLALTMGLLFKVCGVEFIQAAGYNWWNGTIDYPVLPYSSILTSVMGGSVLVVVLILFGFFTQAVQQTFNVLVGGTRLIVAMSMDRVLPEGLGKISRRFRGSPVNAILFLLIGGEVLAVLFLIAPDVESYALSTALAATFYQTLTVLAAAVFPWAAKSIYEASPISKYKVGNIPLITICGAWGVLVGVVLLIFYLTDPGLGLRPLPGETLLGFIGMLVVFLIAFIWFWVIRAVNKSKGVDIDLNFRQLPPE
ncbi:MAG: APC family permease [Anaerolineales bacterium]|nr:MAG: APC family permease [Anaerolineales bacterium]